VDTRWILLRASELKLTHNGAMARPKVKENTKKRRKRVGPHTRESLMGGYRSRDNCNIFQDAFHFSVVACFRCVHFNFQ
jgi:hypothetical protein